MDGPYKESKLPLLSLQKPFLNEAFDTREELRRPENNKLTFALILTVFAAAIGSSFQSGWHTGCVNPIGKVCLIFLFFCPFYFYILSNFDETWKTQSIELKKSCKKT